MDEKNDEKFPTWFGGAEQIAAERGLAEFRSGRPVMMTSVFGTIVGLPVDGLNDERLALFRRLCTPARPHLVITALRARVLGIEAASAVGLMIGDGDSAAVIFSLAAEAIVERNLALVPAGPAAKAAIELAKLAQHLPALLVADSTARSPRSRSPPRRLCRSTADCQRDS